MALKATWKNSTRKGTQVYKVKGTASEIEQFIENNGPETIFEDDDENKPLFFTRTLTKSGNLIWNEEDQRYRVEVTFESAVLMQAAMQAFGATETSSSKSNDDEDESTDEAEIEPAKPKTNILKKKRG
jgi:hypothetical protein